jgi:hypothetical protein
VEGAAAGPAAARWRGEGEGDGAMASRGGAGEVSGEGGEWVPQNRG